MKKYSLILILSIMTITSQSFAVKENAPISSSELVEEGWSPCSPIKNRHKQGVLKSFERRVEKHPELYLKFNGLYMQRSKVRKVDTDGNNSF